MIYIVYGPPAAGKTTFAWSAKYDDDLVVDFDAIAHALGSSTRHNSVKPISTVAAKARAVIVNSVLDGIDLDGHDAYILQSRLQPADIERYGQAGARFVPIIPDLETVLAQAEADNRPEGTLDAIRAWYDDPPTIPEPWLLSPETLKGRHAMLKKSGTVTLNTDEDLDLGEFTAYAATFTREPDSYGDVIAKGAFAKTISEWAASGKTVPLLYGHRMDDPEFFIGSIKTWAEDEHGLWVHGQLDLDNPKAAQVYRLIKTGRINQLSFAYDIRSADWIDLPDGREVYELRELKVHEISLVLVGANQTTEILTAKHTTIGNLDTDKLVLKAKPKADLEALAVAIDLSLAGIHPAPTHNEER